MIEKRANLEVIAPTIEEAIEKGLNDLGLPRSAVEVEILDEGSRGLFGIGARQTRIRLTIKADPETRQVVPPAAQPSAPFMDEPDEPEESFEPDEAEGGAVGPVSSADEEYVLTTARESVKELLEKMKVRATVTAEYGAAEDSRSRVPVRVNVFGDDLSILIGRRAETLNALQYIAGLIISKEIGRSIPLVVDVEGYRERREQQLRQLARRMADQAIKTNRRQVLEPMPANERRIIHIELRNHPDVKTESIGEEPRRKVTINLK